MKKSLAILESHYLPWKGYFDIIGSVDEFVFFEDAAYAERHGSHRTKIKAPRGSEWLTIPVESGARSPQKIRDVQLQDPLWPENHWKAIEQSYTRSPHFSDYASIIEKLYHSIKEPYLSEVNYVFLRTICEVLGINTRFSRSSDYDLQPNASERAISICRQAGATIFLSSSASASQLQSARFASAGIELACLDEDGYPEYPQLHPPFDHSVTILDLLFNTGAEAPRFMKSLSELSGAQ